MKRLRTQLPGLSSAVVALFALTVAVPRAGLYYHEHAGGEHAHVHADDESALADILADYWHGHDHDHGHVDDPHARLSGSAPAHPTAPRAVLARDDGCATGHWHSQDLFQRAVAPAVFAAQYAESVQAAQASPEPAPVDRPALPVRVRGPPRTA